MKYIGWEKRDAPKNKNNFYDEGNEKIINIYVFNNPEIKNYDNGVVGLGALGDNCVFYKLRENVLEKKDTGAGMSKGFHKGYFYKVNQDTKKLSEKIGISNHQLEEILSAL